LSVVYLQVTVENPAEHAAVWIVWDWLEHPTTWFILASVKQKPQLLDIN